MAGGASCGQLLNGAGLIGLFDSFKPKFVKRYGNVGEVAVEASSEFAAEVGLACSQTTITFTK